MFTKGMITVVIGIGGLIITILLGISFFNIAKNLGSYNSVQDISEEESIEMFNKESTEFLNENDSVVLDEESTVPLNEECIEILKQKVEATGLLQNSEDLTGILKDGQINNGTK